MSCSTSLFSLLQRQFTLCRPLGACAAALADRSYPTRLLEGAACLRSWHSTSAASPAVAHADASTSARRISSSATAWLPQFGGYMRTGQAGTILGADDEPRFLVTGASGQIGAELIPLLRERHPGAVVASDVRMSREALEAGPFVYCDVQDKDSLARIILENGVNHVVHLATLLSAIGERNPQLALRVNTAGIQNVLELAAQHSLKVYAPSTIAVFGASTPREHTPDVTVMQPSTMYGITKVHQELLGAYYHAKAGVDFRSLRYPGVISSRTLPGGGTTDYAVEIFHAALTTGSYACFLAAETALPFLYMPDCLAATYQLMMADPAVLQQRTYNVTAMTFTPAELAAAIREHLPGFNVQYLPDFRESIARSWPTSINDDCARRDWGWAPRYDLQGMTAHMLEVLDGQLRGKRDRAAALAAAAAAAAKAAQAAVGPVDPLLPPQPVAAPSPPAS